MTGRSKAMVVSCIKSSHRHSLHGCSSLHPPATDSRQTGGPCFFYPTREGTRIGDTAVCILLDPLTANTDGRTFAGREVKSPYR